MVFPIVVQALHAVALVILHVMGLLHRQDVLAAHQVVPPVVLVHAEVVAQVLAEAVAHLVVLVLVAVVVRVLVEAVAHLVVLVLVAVVVHQTAPVIARTVVEAVAILAPEIVRLHVPVALALAVDLVEPDAIPVVNHRARDIALEVANNIVLF